jgi:glycosyltransferase involved in cell wall biosynthesis
MQSANISEPKIRLCIIVPAHWEALMGGSQYQAKLLIEHLLSLKKYDIYYLARRVNPQYSSDRYHIIRISESSGLKRYGHFFDTFRLFRLLKEIRPDVIYQMVGNAYTGISAYYANRFNCGMIWRITSDKSVYKPMINGWRDILPHRFIERKFTEYGIKNAQSVVAQTNLQARLLKENFGRVASAVIRNYHPEPGIRIVKESDPMRILWVANFKRLKQPEIFVRLAEDLVGRGNVRFTMIGAPAPGEMWFDQLIKKIGLLNNLEYLGIQTQDQVNTLLAKSYILVNTSQYEGFSNTFIQAWIHEVPVVSLNANPDQLLDSGSLGYCASGNYDQLLVHINKLLDNPSLIDKLGRNARNYALEHHSERNISSLIQEINNQCASNLR